MNNDYDFVSYNKDKFSYSLSENWELMCVVFILWCLGGGVNTQFWLIFMKSAINSGELCT